MPIIHLHDHDDNGLVPIIHLCKLDVLQIIDSL